MVSGKAERRCDRLRVTWGFSYLHWWGRRSRCCACIFTGECLLFLCFMWVFDFPCSQLLHQYYRKWIFTKLNVFVIYMTILMLKTLRTTMIWQAGFTILVWWISKWRIPEPTAVMKKQSIKKYIAYHIWCYYYNLISLFTSIICSCELDFMCDFSRNDLWYHYEPHCIAVWSDCGYVFWEHRDWQRFSWFGNVLLFLEGLAGLHQSGWSNCTLQ